ncbi:alpha-mannosidase [Paenibacillus sp. 1P07SE]|uniref:alpha-mannosidase n=1 Tax=Paenibacillus sp. 1P07SE TaxID=3132209 RepID=UPI0039A4F68F
MFWTQEKLQDRLNMLEPLRYRDALGLSCRWQDDEEGAIGTVPPSPEAAVPVELGTRWLGKDRYIWLTSEAQIPAEWQGRKVLGLFNFGIGAGTSGFESLLFVDGEPYQGVDTNHQEVFLPDEAAGRTLQLAFRLWSGLGGYNSQAINEHQLKQAELCWLDEAVDDLYYTGRAMLATVHELHENMAEHHELLTRLDRAFRILDWSRPGSEAFYQSAAEARRVLRESLSELPKHHPVTIQCIGHTHIDVAWLWRLKHTREKSARSFATVLRLMEQDPEYVFLQTQPQLYEYIKQDYPSIYEGIKQRVAEGRWEVGGAMWLEADCNLSSGESLVRQLLHGIRFFQREFDVQCDYLWLPDVFGYSWALPQILAKSGIKTFMTTKISWNQYNRMPHDTFTWRGIDGTEILTHFITTPDPGGSEGSFYYTYNGAIMPETIQGIWDAYRDKNMNRKLLLAYGYGDGGGGVNREMLEMRRRLADMPGLPQVTTGRADAYFEELRETVAASDQYVHTWDGELYLELHRGTYTSQAFIKRMNRKLELLYRETEWLAVRQALAEGWQSYPQEELYEGWNIVLRNQFHDIIPGSSIKEVYDDCKEEYAVAERVAHEAWTEAAEALTTGADAGETRQAFTVWNSANWSRTEEAAILSLAEVAGSWEDERGRPLAAQYAEEYNCWSVLVPDVPGLGQRTIYFRAGNDTPAADSPFRIGASEVESPFYIIAWDDAGRLSRIYDKEAGREVLAPGEQGNVLQVFEDKPKSRHEAWDIDLFYQEKLRTVDRLDKVRIAECGPLHLAVAFTWTYMDSKIEQRMILHAGHRRIDFETRADWQEKRQLLKAAFPVDIRATEATYDIQFGNVRRPTHWNTSWDYARFETVGHQWADLSERGYGVSLLNDCKYGYDIKDHTMRLTLIKSAIVPDPTADLGEHVFTYSLLPHRGDWLEGGTVASAFALNQPLSVSRGAAESLPAALFTIDGDAHVLVDAVKKSEDGTAVVLRLHEYGGSRGELRIASAHGIRSWQACDLLERPEGERGDGDEIRASIKPYELMTFRIEIG